MDHRELGVLSGGPEPNERLDICLRFEQTLGLVVNLLGALQSAVPTLMPSQGRSSL